MIPFYALLESTNEGLYAVESDSRCTFINRAGAAMLGYQPKELLGRNMHEQVHSRRADGSPYPESECPIYHALTGSESVRLASDVLWRKDGTSFPAEYSADPILENGKAVGAVVTFNDITARRRQERRLAMQHEVSRIMAEASTLADAQAAILQAIADAMEWPTGILWTVNRRRMVLDAAAIWQPTGRESAEFEALVRSMALPRGASVAGRVWQDAKLQWVPDIAEDARISQVQMKALGNQNAVISFPIRSKRRVTGVVEFFAPEIPQPDEELHRILTTLGNQIGEFIERGQAEEDVRLRDRAMASSTNGIIITDATQPDNPIVYVNPAFEKLTGYKTD